MTKKGRPARNRISAPWRTIDTHDPPLQSSTAGSATCVRPALLPRQRAHDQHRHRRCRSDAPAAGSDASRCANSRSAICVFRHSKIGVADDAGNCCYRDHARFRASAGTRRPRKRFISAELFEAARGASARTPAASDLVEGGVSSSARSRPYCAVVNARQRLLEADSSIAARARRSRGRAPVHSRPPAT